jgi:hypothetical protein
LSKKNKWAILAVSLGARASRPTAATAKAEGGAKGRIGSNSSPNGDPVVALFKIQGKVRSGNVIVKFQQTGKRIYLETLHLASSSSKSNIQGNRHPENLNRFFFSLFLRRREYTRKLWSETKSLP